MLFYCCLFVVVCVFFMFLSRIGVMAYGEPGYIEIIICQFSYHTPNQPETPISARDSRISPRLIRESRADVGVEG